MTAYYNENNPDCAAWLRRLVSAGLIAPGDVDDRDIRDVCADDVRRYTQCHFFAGLGLWSLALRWAGWGDDRPIWTGSCPCQPFSGAGKGDGFADDRHLWPAWHWLIRQCRPERLAGEQVESRLGRVWLDIVSADLEALGYACGAAVLPVAGLGAPNLRHRIWWVADADGHGRGEQRDQRGQRGQDPDGCGARGGLADAQGEREPERVGAGDRAHRLGRADGQQHGELAPGAYGGPGGVADPDGEDQSGRGDDGPGQGSGAGAGRAQQRPPGFRATGGGVADPESGGRGEHGVFGQAPGGGETAGQPALGDQASDRLGDAEPSRLSDASPQELPRAWRGQEGGEPEPSGRPANPWRELEWIECRDGKRRPTQPGIFPLAARRPGDVAKLRAIGNAISPQVAAAVIKAWMMP